MLRARWGRVAEILAVRLGAVEVRVEFPDAPDESGPALAYPDLTGPLAPGDRVLANTTAVHLGLGTGGLHFIVAVDRGEGAGDGRRGTGDGGPETGAGGHEHPGLPSPVPRPPSLPGHIVKLRYTPLQHTVTTVEERAAAGELILPEDLGGMPVVAAELHSQVAGIAAGVRVLAPVARVAYVMPDTAALPLPLSRLVARLRDTGLLQVTITCGQAFGGEHEAVSVPSALVAAKAMGADVAIVAQGPGNVGTGTPLGFSGISQAEWLHAAHSLRGTPIAAVRLSFADPRPRHRGISHHTLTILDRFTLCRVLVPLPLLPPEQAEWIGSQFAAVATIHSVETHDGEPALALLESLGVAVTTMGRGLDVERAFFLAAGAAGMAAAVRLG